MPRERLVRTLADDVREAGYHEIQWSLTDTDGRRVRLGIYFFRLKIGSWQQRRSSRLSMSNRGPYVRLAPAGLRLLPGHSDRGSASRKMVNAGGRGGPARAAPRSWGRARPRNGRATAVGTKSGR